MIRPQRKILYFLDKVLNKSDKVIFQEYQIQKNPFKNTSFSVIYSSTNKDSMQYLQNLNLSETYKD